MKVKELVAILSAHFILIALIITVWWQLDSKLDRELGTLDAEIEREISALDERLTSRIGALDTKIDKLNGLLIDQLIDLNREIGELNAMAPPTE